MTALGLPPLPSEIRLRSMSVDRQRPSRLLTLQPPTPHYRHLVTEEVEREPEALILNRLGREWWSSSSPMGSSSGDASPIVRER
jgi:hypothetical protein